MRRVTKVLRPQRSPSRTQETAVAPTTQTRAVRVTTAATLHPASRPIPPTTTKAAPSAAQMNQSGRR